jgi:hypothetical protein
MKSLRVFATIIVLLSALFISSCNDLYTTGDYKSFDSRLRGTWISNETGLYSGSLIIDYDPLTIGGYGEDWTSIVGDDGKRPFKGFPKGVPLNGYSEKGEAFEKGEIFIEYPGSTFNSIPYVYTELGTYPQKYKLLEFSFGGRKEILQSQTGY